MTFEQWQAQGLSFTFNGLPIRYWQAGEGEPLLLIHGFPTSSWDWHCIWESLAQHYQVIACDMLGFGLSAKPKDLAYSLVLQADLQQALLGVLNITRPVHVLAHDYGDSVAQELLARHQEGRFNLASCVFLNGGLFPETHKPVLIQKLLLSPIGALVARLFNQKALSKSFAKIFGPNSQLNGAQLQEHWQLIAYNNGPQVMHKLISYIPERIKRRERWVSAMQHTKVPLKVIDGGFDPISGAHMVERYRALIENADTTVLDQVGHYPQLEAPAEVLSQYQAFRMQRGNMPA